MIWDYRIVHRKLNGIDLLQVHTAFFADGHKKNLVYLDSQPATLVGISTKLMLEQVELLTDAFEHPVIYIPSWNTGYGTRAKT